MTVESIDLFVLHQASNAALDILSRRLKIEPQKIFRNLDRVGDTVSASIPIALRDALDSGALSKGDAVLISGFGVGLSWATAIVEV